MSEVDGRLQRGDRTREALLRSARALFALHGRDGASVRDVARHAGVNPGLVRYHFGSKDELYRSAIAEALGGLRERVIVAVGSATSPADAVKRVIDAYLDHIDTDPDLVKLVARGTLDGDDVVVGLVADHIRPMLTLGSTVPGFDPDAALSVFAACVVATIYEPALARIGRDPADPAMAAARRAHIHDLVRRLLG